MGLRGAAAAAVVAAGTAVIKTVSSGTPSGWGPSPAHDDPTRWRVVTVNRPIRELEALPAPLADLGDAVEVRLLPAPADRGTEIHARLTGSGHGGDHRGVHGERPLEALRSALRQAKQVAEVGYVLEADRNRTTKPTPLNEPLRHATKHAGGQGRL